MTHQDKIKEVFTNYGYLIIDAVEPDDPDLLSDLKDLNIKLITLPHPRFIEIKLVGCYSDIKQILSIHWFPHEGAELEETMETFIKY